MAIAYSVNELDCGARLIVAPLQERQSVGVSFGFAVGSRHEDDNNAGLAHFIEHMVFKGTERFPTSREVSEAIEGVGGVLNAVTDREETVFWTRVPTEHLAHACSVLGDMLLRPRLQDAEVIKERGVVIEEIRMYADNPQDHVQTLFDEVMWPDHPLGREVAGNEDTVNSFTRNDCSAHMANYYRPERVVITIAGAAEAEHCRGILNEVLSGWDGPSTKVATPARADMLAKSGFRHDARDTEQTNIVIGTRGPSYFDDDRYAADILNVILGEGMSSRLFLEIRESMGLAYDVHSFTTRLSDTGAIGVGIGCEPKRAVAATKAALKEVKKLATELVSDAELEKAKAYSTGRMTLSLESNNGLGGFLSQQLLLTGRIVTPDEIVAKLRAVTAQDVRRVAAQWGAGHMCASVVGPLPSVGAFEELIGTTGVVVKEVAQTAH